MNVGHFGSRGLTLDWTHTQNDSGTARWPGGMTPQPRSSLFTGVSAGRRHPETTCGGVSGGVSGVVSRVRSGELFWVSGHADTHTPL